MREMATVRTNILLTPTEHRRWSERARAGGMSFAEFVRRKLRTPDDAPTEEELSELASLALELAASVERTSRKVDATLAELRAARDPAWETAMRARVAAELATNPVELDPYILSFEPAE